MAICHLSRGEKACRRMVRRVPPEVQARPHSCPSPKRRPSTAVFVIVTSGTIYVYLIDVPNALERMLDSQDRVDTEFSSARYDDIIVDTDNAQLIQTAAFPHAPAQSPHSPSTGSNSNVIPVNNTYRTTRSGRVVRPPDRWGFAAAS
ncbi:unnamed protein product, partial [Iphiclides podalirius]